MDKPKTYSVTYKVYSNDKINAVPFHGKMLYPLYLQMIWNRKNTVYKSNLFDLFLKPKYGIRVAGELHAPPIDKVIQREEKLIEFVINKHSEDFTLELFKKEYDYYSRDLLDSMEPDFLFYLHTFLQDEGVPYLADSLYAGPQVCHAFEIVNDFKRSLKPDLYQRLIDHSFDYAPPYLVLARFADRGPQRTGFTSLLLMDWEDPKTKEEFEDFVKKEYQGNNLSKILAGISIYVQKSFKQKGEGH